MKLCAVSVDLDEIRYYYRIHGLAEGAGEHLVYELGLERLEDFARGERVPLTWFAIGSDLARDENASKLARLARRGDEIANHTQHHFYDLTRREPGEQVAELEAASAAIASACGERPSGFRAPGYTVSDALLDVAEELGFAYDSSVFPCPAYYAAKAAKLLAQRLRGLRSHALLDVPSVLTAPMRPYRRGRPYWRRGSGLLELPIQVTPVTRLPYIGTSLTLTGPEGARLLTRALIGEPFVNLELHGLDALASDDGLHELARHQPDLRVPAARKLDALSAAIGLLRREGYSFVRLDEAARLLA